MKPLILIASLFACISGYCQIAVNILVPPSGMMDKQQLWNMIVVNSGTTGLNVNIQLLFSDAVTGEPVMSATTADFMLPVGSKQYSADLLGPIQYNILNSAYRVDPGPAGLLPIGNFNVCYSFIENGHNSQVYQECMIMNIPPLSPPLLITPDNQSLLDHGTVPLFTWLPPAPADVFTALQYDFRLVEINALQSSADAMQQNIPILFQHGILSNNLQYPITAPPLDSTRQYAWQVTANNNQNEIGKSEVWTFRLKNADSMISPPKPDAFYIKLGKESEGNVVFFDKIRFSYFNETSDTVWQVSVQDVTTPVSEPFILPIDSIKLNTGENLIEYSVDKDARFINHHIYLLQVPNSRGELWKLRFEFIKQD